MRTWVAMLLLAAAAAAGADPVTRVVDLDQPGAVAALRSANPQHFAKLRRLLEENIPREHWTVEQFVQTAGATDVHTGPLIMTSYPAQMRMSFTLDDTRYVIVVKAGGTRTLRDCTRGC